MSLLPVEISTQKTAMRIIPLHAALDFQTPEHWQYFFMLFNERLNS
jgi:hypothetical protein